MTAWVTLTATEIACASVIGAARFAESVEKNRRDNHGFSPDESGLGIHIEGACGEMAVAKWMGTYWSGHINSFKGPDLGKGIQVRTRSEHHYDLLVRSDDKDSDVFVLVTGVAPRYRIRGWAYGHEAKQREWLKEYGGRPPAYFMPQNALRPIPARYGWKPRLLGEAA